MPRVPQKSKKQIDFEAREARMAKRAGVSSTPERSGLPKKPPSRRSKNTAREEEEEEKEEEEKEDEGDGGWGILEYNANEYESFNSWKFKKIC